MRIYLLNFHSVLSVEGQTELRQRRQIFDCVPPQTVAKLEWLSRGEDETIASMFQLLLRARHATICMLHFAEIQAVWCEAVCSHIGPREEYMGRR